MEGETLVFVVDLHPEVGLKTKEGRSVLELVKTGVKSTVTAKARMHEAHRFGLVVLGDSGPRWELKSFTADPDVLNNAVNALTPAQRAAPFEFGRLVEILEDATFEERLKGRLLRSILLYARTEEIPQWEENTSCTSRSDLVYLHQAPTPSNSPQQVYDRAVELVDIASERASHKAYVFEFCSGLLTMDVLYPAFIACLTHTRSRVDQGARPKPVDIASLNQLPSSLMAAQAEVEGRLMGGGAARRS